MQTLFCKIFSHFLHSSKREGEKQKLYLSEDKFLELNSLKTTFSRSQASQNETHLQIGL